LGYINLANTTPVEVMEICLALPMVSANKVALKPAGNFKPALFCAKEALEIAANASAKKIFTFFIILFVGLIVEKLF
jgi:hypothetical protein